MFVCVYELLCTLKYESGTLLMPKGCGDVLRAVQRLCILTTSDP